MKKKLLSLMLVFVMLSGAILITPEVSPALENAQASGGVKEATASSFEAIAVKQTVSDTVTTLTGGYKSGSDALNLNYNYGTTAPYHRWLYFKYDISALKDIEDIKSAVISIGFNWNKNNGTLYVKSLKESVWNDAVAAIAAVKEDSTTVVDSTKFVYPKNDTAADTLGTVKRSYGNTANNAEAAYRLTGNAYTQSYETTLTGSSMYRTATFAEGSLLKYVQDAVENDKDYLYFSVCYYSTASKASDRYGNYRFYASANSIKVSDDVMVLYNSVAGTKFNASITTLDRETDFTYTVNIATKDTNVRLLAAIHGKYGALSGVVMSDTLSSNNGNLSLTVPLSEYPDATSVRCFIWDGNTLRPYAEPKETPVKTLLQEQFSGKKVIFIGNSFIYYGRTVKHVNSKYYEQSDRINDKGGFYQLCKQNGIDVEVTNWTFGGHKLGDLFGDKCAYSDCPNYGEIKHEDYLTDKYYDYVVVSPGSGERQSNEFMDNIEYITDFFQATNPNVEIIILGNTAGHGVGKELTTITSNYKTLYNAGYPIADWGHLVKNIIDGTETVPGATQIYNKNTFIVDQSSSDGYHPNLLSGYITTLFTYCTITGEKALGQPYMYFWDSTTAPANVASYVADYYTDGDADTTFPEILNSESDIRGIQKLIDKYMEEKAFLTEY